jgi:hypothetical protein
MAIFIRRINQEKSIAVLYEYFNLSIKILFIIFIITSEL